MAANQPPQPKLDTWVPQKFITGTTKNSQDPRILLKQDSQCEIWSRSKKKWYSAIVKQIYIDPKDHKEWFVVKYDKKKSKKIQRFCNDLRVIPSQASLIQQQRNASDRRRFLKVFSTCQVYSNDKHKWFDGFVQEIYIEPKSNTEYLIIKYGKNETKKVERFGNDLRCITTQQSANTDTKQNDQDQKNEIHETIKKPLRPRAILKTIGGWQQLAGPQLPSLINGGYSNMCMINDREFIIATQSSIQSMGGIYRYNTTYNQWDLLIAYPKKAPSLSHPLYLEYDKISNCVYVMGTPRVAGGCAIVKFEVNASANLITKAGNRTFRGSGRMVLTVDDERKDAKDDDGKLHIISGDGSDATRYNVLATSNFAWSSMENYEPWEMAVIPYGLIHVRSHNKLFVFGTMTPDSWIHTDKTKDIWTCVVGCHEWKMMEDLKLPFGVVRDYCMVKTLDEKYVIFFSDGITILDLETMRFYKCTKVQLPRILMTFNAVILPYCTDDESKVVTYRYITDVIYNGEGVGRIIPMDMIRLIAMYWVKEFIYLLGRNVSKPKLWGVCLDDVLNCMQLV